MIIRYSDGSIVEAAVVTRDENRVRVAVRGADDLLEFNKVKDTWVSEDLEPVEIQFQWQARGPEPTFSENDFICSQELAARLMNLLVEDGSEEKEQEKKPKHLAAGRGLV